MDSPRELQDRAESLTVGPADPDLVNSRDRPPEALPPVAHAAGKALEEGPRTARRRQKRDALLGMGIMGATAGFSFGLIYVLVELLVT